MRKFDLSLRSSRSSYFATFRHQLTILAKTDALDEEKWLNMLGTFVKDWFRYKSQFIHAIDSIFFNVTAPTLIYTLSLHDALPIYNIRWRWDSDAFGTTVPNENPSSLGLDRKSTRLNSSHSQISYAVFCLKKKTW